MEMLLLLASEVKLLVGLARMLLLDDDEEMFVDELLLLLEDELVHEEELTMLWLDDELDELTLLAESEWLGR
jgi:hypothetical protein